MGLTRFKFLYKGQRFQYKNTILEKISLAKAKCLFKSPEFKEGEEIALPPKTQVFFNPKGKNNG